MPAEATQPPDHTLGEQTFEAYLCSQGLTDFIHEKPFPNKAKRPDYSLILDGRELLFEVKDIDSRPQPDDFFGFFDPYAPIREKINQAGKKFREFKEFPCSLVLFVGQGFAFIDQWKIVFGAMHGDMGFQQHVDTRTGLPVLGSESEVFGRRGRMTRPHWSEPQNTTINAIVALRWIAIGQKRFVHRHLSQFTEAEFIHHLDDKVPYDKAECVPGVIVYENLDAAWPLPRDLFTGPFDLRYAWGEDGSLTTPHVGDGVKELEELENLSKETAKKTAADWLSEP